MWLALLLSVNAQEVVAGPLVQSFSPQDAWIVWQADTGEAGGVTWTWDEVDTEVAATMRPGPGAMPLFEAHLTGLPAGEAISYRVSTSTAASTSEEGPFPIRVPLPPGEADSTTLLAISDMQRSGQYPDKFDEIVNEGVLAVFETPSDQLQMVLVAGDLVDAGWRVSDWTDDFFGPGQALLSRVPSYPVFGNHEDDSSYFLDYFHLPENGTAGFMEHWWWWDSANVRVIGLDSNANYWVPEQFEWLDARLAETCDEDHVDFLVVQLHHPFQSELWTPGESPWTGQVQERLEAFSTDCGRPSVLLFGHTHGYSRGQSRDHKHAMVNVATAGGTIDPWGSGTEANYPEYSISTADWGFVTLEAHRGDLPTMELVRYSRGDGEQTLDNAITDSLMLRRGGEVPATPQILVPAPGAVLGPDCVTLTASAFEETEDDHGATHWQVSRSCSFSELLDESWVQHEDWFFGVDLRKGKSLVDHVVRDLPGDATICARVRYRDQSLDYSDWSETITFSTRERTAVGPLLAVDFESGLGGLTTSGETHILSGECPLPPAQGSNFLAIGGECDPVGDGTAEEVISLIPWADVIDAGDRALHVSAQTSGIGRLEIAFLDDDDAEIDNVGVDFDPIVGWSSFEHPFAVPAFTRRVQVVFSSMDDVVALDDLRVYLTDGAQRTCDQASDPDGGEVEDPDEEGCSGCHTGAGFGALWLLPLLLRRRRRSEPAS